MSKSTFTTPADLRIHGVRRWQLLAPFEYHVGSFPSKQVITVPAGTVTDLASVPRLLWVIFPPTGRYDKAAIIHDHLYTTKARPRAEVDRIFLEAMQVLGVGKITRTLMYWAVRCFGWRWYPHQ